jgi:hypothetical protein
MTRVINKLEPLEKLAKHGVFIAKLGSKCEPALIAVGERTIKHPLGEEHPLGEKNKTNYLIGPGSNGFLRYRIEQGTSIELIETENPGILKVFHLF